MKRSVLSVIAVLAILVLATLAPAPPSLAAGEPERVLVEFAPGRAAAARNALEGAGGQIHYQFDSLNTFAVTLPAAALDGISRNPNVVSVEPDAPRYPMAQEIPWGITDVQAPQVQTAGVTGAGTKVCIIDSGLYTAHEDLLGVPATGYGTDWNRDFCGHGTHVAGTIAAANNGVGVVGVAPAVSLFSVKVFGDDCSWTYTSTLVDATNRCVAGGAKIISMSLGGAKSSRTERTQFANLYSAGILSIAAAGNEGTTAYSYPASYDTVVSVAAIDSSKTVADFSQQNDQVELAAPGVSVLSTVPWLATVNLTVGGATYPGQHIENAAYGTATGALANGGLCDSTGSWSGKVVLCERGVISFYDKVMNVQNSGGAAAVIYNNEPGNFLGTLGDGYSSTILAISLSQEDGQYLVANKLDQSGTVASSVVKPYSGYEDWDGTSMATPHVSGVAALLWSSNPALTNVQIRNAMAATAMDLGADGRDNAYGYGLVQAKAALDSLGGAPVNQPPAANFTFTTSDLTATFTDASSDSDGTIESWSWSFGDGSTSTAQNPSHTYAAAGTYSVTLTVTDDDGATGTTSKNVTVSTTPGGITLSVKITKVKNVKYADLTWSGAGGTDVKIIKNGGALTTTANDGTYRDGPLPKTGSASYQVCEEGSTTCSEIVTVSW